MIKGIVHPKMIHIDLKSFSFLLWKVIGDHFLGDIPLSSESQMVFHITSPQHKIRKIKHYLLWTCQWQVWGKTHFTLFNHYLQILTHLLHILGILWKATYNITRAICSFHTSNLQPKIHLFPYALSRIPASELSSTIHLCTPTSPCL